MAQKKAVTKLSRKEAEAKIRKLASKGKITFAPQHEVHQYHAEVKEILEKLLGHPEAWVSDESSIGDFPKVEGGRRKFMQLFGFMPPVIKTTTRIVDLAKFLQEKRNASRRG